jgi:hypothetical protein
MMMQARDQEIRPIIGYRNMNFIVLPQVNCDYFTVFVLIFTVVVLYCFVMYVCVCVCICGFCNLWEFW